MIQHNLGDIVPKRFYHYLNNYIFCIEKPHCKSINRKIEIRCNLLVNNNYRNVNITIAHSNIVSRSIDEIQCLARNGNWVFKYLTLYSVYERLYAKRDCELAALRHALAHKPDNLSNDKTIKALMNTFGTHEVNIYESKQTQVFWKMLCRLVIEIDRALVHHFNLLLGKEA